MCNKLLTRYIAAAEGAPIFVGRTRHDGKTICCREQRLTIGYLWLINYVDDVPTFNRWDAYSIRFSLIKFTNSKNFKQ